MFLQRYKYFFDFDTEKIKITAKGNKNYKSATKYATITVKIK